MTARILGILLLVAGLLVLGFGLNATDSVADTVKESVTGRFTDKTMWYLIGGGVLAVSGLALTLRGGHSAKN